jgi:bifunctional non-homologous end joining protein LigD
VVLQKNGVSSFQALQNALAAPQGVNLHFYAFDLPYLDGHDLRQVPLVERKRLLERLLRGARPPLHYSPHVQGQGREFYEQGCRMKLEGVIAKLADAPYVSGRGRSWVKVKCIQRQEMVIGGYTDPEGSRTGLGALLLGVHEPGGKLRYSGRVGTGFNEATLKDLRRRLDELEQDDAPFYNPPRGWEAKGAHWVKPELVGEIAFTEWTNEGTLRHPSFQGLRLDKKAGDVVRETPASAPDERAQEELQQPAAAKPAARKRSSRRTKSPARARRGAEAAAGGIRLSNPDKALYPESGITKRDLAGYYAAVAKWILPHLAQRPLSLVRCPNGWRRQCFFQKNADKSSPEALERVTVRTSGGPASYMMANSADALAALAQMGVLEIHPWGSTAKSQGCPDRIIFDIDPGEGVEWPEVAQAAREVRTLLEGLGLRSYLKTTGGKGLHVVVPVQPRVAWDEVKGFSKAIADLFARTFPDRYTSSMSKAKRRGKIFIDYLRNAEGATAVCAYSTRARENAPVAMPLGWKELGSEDVRFDHFHIGNVPQRLKRLKADPWKGFFELGQSVTAKMMREVGYKS